MTPSRQPSQLALFTDLSTFQLTILGVLAREGPQYGLALRDELEDNTDLKIYGGKLYPNLDQLAEEGVIEIRSLDRRTNEYALTDEGERILHAVSTWLSDCLGESPETTPSDQPSSQNTANGSSIAPEKRCTSFTTQHGLSNPPTDTVCFAFICPHCEHTNPLKGSPHDFREQSIRCLRCTWVAVLDGTALEQFAEGIEGVKAQ